MKSICFCVAANLAAVFLIGSILSAGDRNEGHTSISEAASVTRAVQEFMAAVAKTSAAMSDCSVANGAIRMPASAVDTALPIA